MTKAPNPFRKPTLRSDAQHRRFLEEQAAAIAAAMEEMGPQVTKQDFEAAAARREDWDRIGEALGQPRERGPSAAEVVLASKGSLAGLDCAAIGRTFAVLFGDQPKTLAEQAELSNLNAAIRRSGYDAPPDPHSAAGQVLAAAAKARGEHPDCRPLVDSKGRPVPVDASGKPLDPGSTAYQVVMAGRKRRGEI